MSGDYSRDRFDPTKNYNGVLRQQGRVELDSDANEDVAIRERRVRVGTLDSVGRTGVPETTPDAFKIGFAHVLLQRLWLTVGPGRIYVDGLLAENHGAIPRSLDLVLGELYGTAPSSVDPPPEWQSGGLNISSVNPVSPEVSVTPTDMPLNVMGQPLELKELGAGENIAQSISGALSDLGSDVPTAQPNGPSLVIPNTSIYLAYLEVWQREVNALQAPELVEPALGIDTTTRTRIEWKVRFLPLPIGTQLPEGPCDSTLWQNSHVWKEICAPSRGRLSVTTISVASDENPCEPSPSGGYRGRGNQLYRVEIHDVINGTARFKWSRDNGSVATAVLEVIDNTRLRVSSLGRDNILGFRQGDWIEIVSDVDELADDTIHSGFMARIAEAPMDQTLKLDREVNENLKQWIGNPEQAKSHHLRVRRWDQQPSPEKSGHFQDGLIPATVGQLVDLEAGIQVQLGEEGDAAGPAFRPGDYWLFAVRATDSSLDELDNAPPKGIHRHHCPLALVDFASKQVRDCRVIFPSLTGAFNLFYLGGDGQEVIAPSVNQPTAKLPARLRVGVSRGPFPVAGIEVRFKVKVLYSISPQLSSRLITKSDPQGAAEISVLTGPDGVAECGWVLLKEGTHTAEARLGEASGGAHLPIRFTATTRNPAVTGGGCVIPVAAGTSIVEVLQNLGQMAGGGATDFCLCLEAGSYDTDPKSVFPVVELPDDDSQPPRTSRGKGNLKIRGCGEATRIQLPHKIHLKRWLSVTLSDLVIYGGENREGALFFEECEKVTLEGCGISALPGRREVSFGVVHIEGAREVEVTRCSIEADNNTDLPERWQQAFSSYGYDSVLSPLSQILSSPGRAKFERCIGNALPELVDNREEVAAALEKFIEQQVYGAYTQGERGALCRLLEALEEADRLPGDVGDALRMLRRASLQAFPSLALVLDPQLRLEGVPSCPKSGLHAMGEESVRVTNNDIIGVLALNGASGDNRLSAKDRENLCWKVSGDKGDEEFRGTAGSCLLRGNRITLIAMGNRVIRALRKSTLPVFKRLILAENVLEGMGHCVVGESVVCSANSFPCTAVWGISDDENCVVSSPGSLQFTPTISGEVIEGLVAILVAQVASITANVGQNHSGDLEVEVYCPIRGVSIVGNAALEINSSCN